MTTPSEAFVYPWESAPEWAMWAATDADGSQWWFNQKPRCLRAQQVWDVDDVGPRVRHGFTAIKGPGACPTWRDSLQSRPVGGVEGGQISADQALADVHAICDGLADVTSEKVPAMHRLFAFIEQQRTPPQVEPVSGGEAAAWITEDGERVITAKTRANRSNLGPASAFAAFTIPLYRAPVCDRVAGEGEIEALRKDAARLQWLLESPRTVSMFDALFTLPESDTPEAYWDDVRSSIDTAIASTLAPTALNGGE